MSVDYADFLAGKRRKPPQSGISIEPGDLSAHLFDFQRHMSAWAIRRGRAALWADTGLGKTRMQVEWISRVCGDGRGLILAPLGVTDQTAREARRMGTDVVYCRDQSEADALPPRALAVTNYERLDKFEVSRFDAVVLDESSILKSYSGTTKRALVEAFSETPYRLCCTATPAPNDLEELCNHADFLGIMSPAEMRSTFFIADSRGEFMKYRIKGHAKSAFYEWLASWAMACRSPADLGFDGAAFELPGLRIHDHFVPTDWAAEGELFTPRLEGITQRAQVRKDTLNERVSRAIELASADDDQWLVWCGLNAEQDAVAAGLGDQCVSISGTTPNEDKLAKERAWREGSVRVLVTKPSVFGFGMNWQHCHKMAFVGLSDSYESYYQSIRRCHRYGQTEPVEAHVILADVEHVIADNVRAKESQARSVTAGLVAAISAENRHELFEGTSHQDGYEPRTSLKLPDWIGAA